jgi:hypothetical protein
MPFLHGRKIFTGLMNKSHKYFNLTVPKSLYYDEVLKKISESISKPPSNSSHKSRESTHLMVSINFTEGLYKIYD